MRATSEEKTAKAAAKYERKLRAKIRKNKSDRFALKISRAGLWLIPIIGWIFLPFNSAKIRRLTTSIDDNEARLFELEQAKFVQ